MKTQDSDTLIYQGGVYDVIETLGGRLFRPQDYGIDLGFPGPDSFRDYHLTYQVNQGHLQCAELLLKKQSGPCVPVNGRFPSVRGGGVLYKNLNMPIPYAGELTVARNFQWPFYNILFDSESRDYEEILTLLFFEGELTEVSDGAEEYQKTQYRRQGLEESLTEDGYEVRVA